MTRKALDTDPDVHYHYVVAPNGTYTKTKLTDSTTTYVTFESDGLPLVRPLKLFPGGDILAEALEPTLTEIVNAGYDDGLGVEGNEAIPKDPRVPRPMGWVPPLPQTDRLADSVRQGLEDGAETAQEDFENPGNFVTKPLAEFGKLPGISSLPTSNNTFTTNGASKFSPDAKKAGTSSSTDRPRPLKKIADNIRSSLNRLSQKDEPPENKEP